MEVHDLALHMLRLCACSSLAIFHSKLFVIMFFYKTYFSSVEILRILNFDSLGCFKSKTYLDNCNRSKRARDRAAALQVLSQFRKFSVGSKQ